MSVPVNEPDVIPYAEHTYHRFLLFGLFLWAVIFGFIFANLPDVTAAGTCQEDEACWDWRTMGNRAAGFHLNDIEACDGQEPGDVIVVNMNDGIPCKRAAY